MGIAYNPKIVTDGLILGLDAANVKSYPGSGTIWYDLSGNGNNFNLYNTPTFSAGQLTFNGSTQYAKSVNSLNLSSYSSITTIIGVKTNNTLGGMLFEHTSNWNSFAGGFGLNPHSNGSSNVVNLHHTNHNTEGARNYDFVVGTSWGIHTNIFSKVADATGRQTYTNNDIVNFSSVGGYPTSTTTVAGSFANDYMFIGSRAGTGSFLSCSIGFLLIYGRKLSQTEISQAVYSVRGRYGI